MNETKNVEEQRLDDVWKTPILIEKATNYIAPLEANWLPAAKYKLLYIGF